MRCETCCQGGPRHYEGKGWFCRQCRPMPSAVDLVEAARQATIEERWEDLRRLLRLLAVAVKRPKRRGSRSR